ncbi:MAG: AAA family ATPase [Candidatus Pacebacteria bacterium]|nr:AAA family ATPase [Candidatus Paceibacterota bacterium]
MKNKIVCVVGMAGAGKSLVSDELVKKGFSYLRFGQITLDKIKERGIELNGENERKVREELRREYGMGAFATLNLSKIEELLTKSNVVVDGLYSWSEYKILKEKYGDLLCVAAVFAPPSLRYERLEGRHGENDEEKRFRPFTKEEAKRRDYAEIENIEKGGPIAMADFTIINIGSVKEVIKEVNKLLREI